ncbi:MAG: UDP-N-acetylmuramoyl-tripeptide--D-alanyl-D-alanine ligase [Clostridiales bacterium]|nr:UDP-N-acetylmuramoyl-tripeptide--D-alanyl-D-alanine ligase [Clostridiales bacterium]
MDFYISVGLIAVAALLSCAVSIPILKILQLSGYKATGVISWWKSTGFDTLIRYIALTLFGFIALIVYVSCFATFEYARYCAVALYVILCIVFLFAVNKSGSSAIKYTPRMKRLIAADLVLTLILGAGAAWAAWAHPYCQTVTAALGVFVPFVAIAANAIMSPIEKLNNRKYVRRAKTKLQEKKPIVIGITGSYGKTTAKNILKAMLGDSVLATPGSFNTPMGVCLTVNNELEDQKYFIAELGARYKGDIKELCDIVSPTYGIITAIGDMHIATLKSREGVANAKYELGENLPENGLLVLNGYNTDCAALKEREALCEKIVTGEAIAYKDVKIDGNGTTFTLVIDGEEHVVTTSLLGAHVAELTCLCAAVALKLGVAVEQILSAVEGLSPVEHRLQLIKGGAVTVIDDAYNSNPVGAKNALAVLKCFDSKKIIITPGFVELGAIEKQSNFELGKNIAEVCDYAYLVGSRSDDIKKGALEAGMDESAVQVFGSRDEAVKALEAVTDDKVVLFENDLPDNIK